MERPSCFVYCEGEHFALPGELAASPRALCEFARQDEAGRIAPLPGLFRPAARPEDADFFLFPYGIGLYNDTDRLEEAAKVIAALPFFSGREKRHIVFDDGDRAECLDLGLCLFKYSVSKQTARLAVSNALPLPAHVARDKPEFDFEGIRHDVSFVGNLTHEARRAAVLSIQKQAPELRLKADFDDAFHTEGRHIRIRQRSAEENAARENLYRKSVKESWTVLCPPGVGLQSFRMYETMYLGRIPVLFGDQTVYPFERDIDYAAFSLRIGGKDILNTGSLLAAWLGGLEAGALRAKCVLACKTWQRFFAPENKAPLLFKEAVRHFGL